MPEDNEPFAKRDVVLGVKIDESPLAKLTCLRVVNWLLKSHNDSTSTIWIDSDDVETSLLVDGGVIAT